jgi:hypothetical protein
MEMPFGAGKGEQALEGDFLGSLEDEDDVSGEEKWIICPDPYEVYLLNL